MTGLTLKEFPIYYRMLLHLAKHQHLTTDRAVPYALSCDGIADAIGRQRSQVSITAGQLEDQGWAVRESRRVIGEPALRKVVLLTEQGFKEAARAARIVEGYGLKPEDVIRAPPIGTAGDRLNEIARRLTAIECEAKDLRRELDGIRGFTA